jgi:hypothetical protein
VAPQARRGPAIRELEAAVTKVASTEAAMNREAIKEAKWFRDAFIEHRDETRKAFAATHELITRLHREVMADIAGLAACRTRIWICEDASVPAADYGGRSR